MNTILITGGTGHLGKEVVSSLKTKDCSISVLSTKPQSTDNKKNNIEYYTGNLAENIDLKEATKRADIVIHCASNPRNFNEVDINGTKNLLNAIDKQSIKHLVYISIVGVDKSDYPYYKAKLEVENLIAQSGIPFSIVRTTQFHHFIATMIRNLIDENNNEKTIVKIPEGMYFQSIATKEVAELLVNTALGSPKGLLPGFGGPEVLTFEEMAKSYLQTLSFNGQIRIEKTDDIRHQLFRSGVNLCPKNSFGKETWQSYLNLKKNESY